MFFRVLITISIFISTVNYAIARTYNYSGLTNSGQMVDINVTNYSGNINVDGYNYSTGSLYDGNLRPNGLGGLSGEIYNYDTGEYTDVDIDRFGNVDLWEY